MAEQDSVLTQIARPYASALFDLALSEKSLDSVETELKSVIAMKEESADFSRFLASPVIGGDAKALAIDAILAKSGVSKLTGNFIKIVARNGRLFALAAIIKAFTDLAAKARGEVSADVTSAVPLSASQLSELAETLKGKIGKKVTLTQHVDASLIGGLIVKVGSQMIDSSLKTKLTAMKIAMKEVG